MVAAGQKTYFRSGSAKGENTSLTGNRFRQQATTPSRSRQRPGVSASDKSCLIDSTKRSSSFAPQSRSFTSRVGASESGRLPRVGSTVMLRNDIHSLGGQASSRLSCGRTGSAPLSSWHFGVRKERAHPMPSLRTQARRLAGNGRILLCCRSQSRLPQSAPSQVLDLNSRCRSRGL